MQESTICPQSRRNIRRILHYFQSIFSLDAVMLVRLQDDTCIVDYLSGSYPGLHEAQQITFADSIFDYVISGNVPAINADTSCSSLPQSTFSDMKIPGAVLTADIRDPLGGLYGLLCAINAEPLTLRRGTEENLLDFCAAQIEFSLSAYAVSENQSAQIEVLTEEAYHDGLTGLFNRNGWQRIISRTLGDPAFADTGFAVLVADLDALKALNDSYGHVAGDTAISHAADVMVQLLIDDHDTLSPSVVSDALLESSEQPKCIAIARIGGDEFAAIIAQCNDTVASSLTERLMKKLDQVNIPASVGYACCNCPSNLPDAISNADEAMYAEKAVRKLALGTAISVYKTSG